MDKQADIIIHGRVQKAGFRDFIDEMAFNLALNGYVKKLDDGTVHVICEGEETKIKEFVEKININQYPIRVEKIDIKYKSPTHKFKTFEIIRDEDISTATYDRMDAAARYMREMNTNLSQKIVGLGDILGQKIDQSRIEITSEIHSQRDDLKAHFDERLTKMESELIEIKTRVDTIQYISPSKISSKTEGQKAK
ncbi:MAG: acylphosphatase [Candidatus Methanoperedens sp.]|nr:acylphosphatase [Candidatus Methanoperedens sp.]